MIFETDRTLVLQKTRSIVSKSENTFGKNESSTKAKVIRLEKSLFSQGCKKFQFQNRAPSSFSENFLAFGKVRLGLAITKLFFQEVAKILLTKKRGKICEKSNFGVDESRLFFRSGNADTKISNSFLKVVGPGLLVVRVEQNNL